MLKISRFPFALSISFLVVFSANAQQTKTNQKAENNAPRTESKIPEGKAQFTEDELKEYYLVYTDADVKYLRKVFDDYLDNKRLNADEKDALQKTDKKYLKSKFIVLSHDRNLLGGQDLTIVFQDLPDKVFTAWIYKKKNTYELRNFEENDSFNEEDIKRIQIRYRRFIEDKKHAL